MASVTCGCGSQGVIETVSAGADARSKRVKCIECGAALLMYSGELRQVDRAWSERERATVRKFAVWGGVTRFG